MSYNKLHPIALALTVALLAGASTLGAGLFVYLFLNGKPITAMVGSVYVSYNTTIVSCLLAATAAFGNGLIGGYIAAFVYNFLIKYIK